MCTVTIFFKGKNDFVLTSNRDEAPDRIAKHPQLYKEHNVEMLFPKDELAGGTWIGVSKKNRLLCLLNGGFIKHKRKSKYTLSRGTIVKKLLASNTVLDAIHKYDFNNVEPFTIVIVDWNTDLQFMELVWDGQQSHFRKLPLETRIWSSSTLYTEEMKTERLEWFEKFIIQNELNAKSILDFHKSETQNKDYGIVMDRGLVKTTSITQIEKTNDVVKMHYLDLMKNSNYTTNFQSSSMIHE